MLHTNMLPVSIPQDDVEVTETLIGDSDDNSEYEEIKGEDNKVILVKKKKTKGYASVCKGSHTTAKESKPYNCALLDSMHYN